VIWHLYVSIKYNGSMHAQHTGYLGNLSCDAYSLEIQDDIMRLTEHSLQVARLHSNRCTACQSGGNHSTSQITSCRLYHQPKPLMYSSILAKFPHVRLYNQPKSLIPGSPGAKIPHCCLYKEAFPPSCNCSPADFLHSFPHITGKSLLTP
jgi:hypothetical protein